LEVFLVHGVQVSDFYEILLWAKFLLYVYTVTWGG